MASCVTFSTLSSVDQDTTSTGRRISWNSKGLQSEGNILASNNISTQESNDTKLEQPIHATAGCRTGGEPQGCYWHSVCGSE